MRIPLFDIDKTLVSGDNQAHLESFDFALRHVYKLGNASIKEINLDGMIDTQILIEVLKLHNVSENESIEKIPQAIQVMEEYYLHYQNVGELKVIKGAEEILQILKFNNVPCGLLSGNIESIGWHKLDKVNLKKFFRFGAFGNMAYRRVDLIDIAKKRAEETLHKPLHLSDFFIVGDSPLDISCAKAGNIPVVAVAQGSYSKEDLDAAGADLTLASLEESDKFLNFIQPSV